MLVIKYALVVIGVGMFAVAAAILSYDFFLLLQYRRTLTGGAPENLPAPRPPRWPLALKLGAGAVVLFVLSNAWVVVPSGYAGVRTSEISGTLPGTLYPGAHLVAPFVQDVALYDTRERVFSTASSEDVKSAHKAAEESVVALKVPQMLQVQAREGLPIGLALSVRYRLEASRLDYIHNNLPADLDAQLVAPAIASVFRDLVPGYTVREVFTTKREEILARAAGQIQGQLSKEGILVEEVMLRDVQLPPEYMEGLQNLLAKEQEDDRMGVETEIQGKQVKIAELQAEQEKVRAVKQAEGQANVRVLQAKAEADAMQYTLPLKQKQIEQSRLEAEARKEATIKNAEAAGEAKVIDGKAETERRKLLAGAEADRIRVVASADAERMRSEAAALRQNPLLINKIFAERLSDKIRIMMVPTDGKFFLGDMMKGTMPDSSPSALSGSDESPDDSTPTQ